MLYEVTLFQSYFGKSPVNRFNYISSGTPASVSGSFALLYALGFLGATPVLPFRAGTLAGALVDLVSTALTYTGAIAKAIYDPVDFYEAAFLPPEPGLKGGDPMSPTSAWGFRSNRVRTDIGRGYKRFAGATESAYGPGGIVVEGVLAEMNVVAQEMSDTLTYNDEGNTLTFTPAVVHKLKYAPKPGRVAYKYYPTLVEQMEWVAQGVDWEPYVSQRTQRSRQY